MGIKLVKAADNNADFLAKVCRNAKEIYSEIMSEAFERQAEKFETKGVPEKYNICLIQKFNKKIGFIGIKKLNKAIIYLVGLYLLSDYQRRGYGSEVIEKIINNFREKDYEEIILLVHKNAYWAIDFYKKVDFKLVTDNFEMIKEYADGAMEEFAITSTILMKKSFE